MQHYSAVKGHVGLQLDLVMWTGYCKNTKRWTCLTRFLFCKLCWGKSLTRDGNCVYLHLQSQSELTLMCRISDGGSWGFPAGDGGWGMHLSPEWPAAALWRRWMRNAHCCCAGEWGCILRACSGCAEVAKPGSLSLGAGSQQMFPQRLLLYWLTNVQCWYGWYFILKCFLFWLWLCTWIL